MKTIQLQMSVTVGDDSEKILVDLLVQAIKQVTTEPRVEADEKRAARLAQSRNAIFAGQKPPKDAGLLIDSKEVSKLLKLSPRTVWAMQNDGRMPPPIRIGSAVRWNYETLKNWIDQGCPTIQSHE